MTAKDIRNYGEIENKIMALKQKIVAVSDSTRYSDKVYGSNPEYPYEEMSFKIVGSDSVMSSKQHKELVKMEKELAELERTKSIVEWLLENTEDDKDKEILRYLSQGLPQSLIASAVGMDQSSVSRHIDSMIKNIMLTLDNA